MKDQRTYYRKAIEVVGMLASRRNLHNALNRIAAQTEDMELASLVTKLREDLLTSQTNTLSFTLIDMAQSKGNAARTISYCRNRLGLP